jgi:hypothetical protein
MSTRIIATGRPLDAQRQGMPLCRVHIIADVNHRDRNRWDSEALRDAEPKQILGAVPGAALVPIRNQWYTSPFTDSRSFATEEPGLDQRLENESNCLVNQSVSLESQDTAHATLHPSMHSRTPLLGQGTKEPLDAGLRGQGVFVLVRKDPCCVLVHTETLQCSRSTALGLATTSRALLEPLGDEPRRSVVEELLVPGHGVVPSVVEGSHSACVGSAGRVTTNRGAEYGARSTASPS